VPPEMEPLPIPGAALPASSNSGDETDDEGRNGKTMSFSTSEIQGNVG
jgi:hypothetical protein